ncbi:thyrostimulin beta-5 subunit [Cephus cinctus]|uniref:Thyrostimulin beta-5 subunit n=1 Tax=Cephus cinctus TaxID=211228 RepID=A0AAJ7CFE1_CEPCN|nr:thyrostimulin beta-5 subunit [Cephus cinctus]
MAVTAVLVAIASLILFLRLPDASGTPEDLSNTLECHRRLYNYRVSQPDEQGRECWDFLSVWSCWGRCDSNEISDWRFPYKRSHHPVCIHDGRQRSVTVLRNCEEGVMPGTERYEYLEAESCKCAVCKSSETSCEGLRYRGQRSLPGFETNNIPEDTRGVSGFDRLRERFSISDESYPPRSNSISMDKWDIIDTF